MTTVKVSKKHQIAVPAAVRRQLGIRAGDRLRVEIDGSSMILRRERPTKPAPTTLREFLDLAPELWEGIDSAGYLRELRDEWSHREL